MKSLHVEDVDVQKSQSDMKKYVAPNSLDATGVSVELLKKLTLKHLLVRPHTLQDLEEVLKLPFKLVEEIIENLKLLKLLSVGAAPGSDMLYSLTESGRLQGLNAKQQDGYVGPAPISLDLYEKINKDYSIVKYEVTRESLEQCLAGVVIEDGYLDSLGPALSSGKSMFIYGPAGSGKTFISQRLINLFNDYCYVPYAIAIEEKVLPVYDAMFHKMAEVEVKDDGYQSLFVKKEDKRLVKCYRPNVIVGGEMGLDMLDVQYDSNHKTYKAPLQLKANGGIFIIDDMGRQKCDPKEIFNRWIVPMEENRDFLSIGFGQQFTIPFNQLLIFSSNLNPLELADEAFLRRIGYKIHFSTLTEAQFREIWVQECEKLEIEHSEHVLDYVINELYGNEGRPFLPCQPRDLLKLAKSQAKFNQDESVLSSARMSWAWRTYFVELINH